MNNQQCNQKCDDEKEDYTKYLLLGGIALLIFLVVTKKC